MSVGVGARIATIPPLSLGLNFNIGIKIELQSGLSNKSTWRNITICIRIRLLLFLVNNLECWHIIVVISFILLYSFLLLLGNQVLLRSWPLPVTNL